MICCTLSWNLHHYIFVTLLVLVQIVTHFVHDCLLLKACPETRWHCKFSSLHLLLDQSFTLGKHCAFECDSNYFTNLFRVDCDFVNLAIVNLRVVANQVDIGEQLLY